MAFNNDTNKGRVTKMTGILELMEVSGRSNRATAEDYREMLTPVLEAIYRLTGGAPVAVTNTPTAAPENAPSAAPGQWGAGGPAWASVRDMAEQADLKDLSVAMAVYMNRVDEALSGKGE